MRYGPLRYKIDYHLMTARHTIQRLYIAHALLIIGCFFFALSFNTTTSYVSVSVLKTLNLAAEASSIMLYSSTIILISMVLVILRK